MNIASWINYRGIFVVLSGFLIGLIALLPVMGIGYLLPNKARNHELTPLFLGVLAGSIGMYLFVNYKLGTLWY